MEDLNNLADFLVKVSALKRTMRYKSCPVHVQEPVAGHSWLLTFMVPVVAEKLNLKIDVQRAMEIANVHDLPEHVYEYDFDSYLVAKGIMDKELKSKNEEEVMLWIRDKFSFGKRIYELWEEYEGQRTPEAKYVKALDKLESNIHIIERGGTGRNADDARHQILLADEAVKNFPELKPFLKVLKNKLRPLLEAQGLIWTDAYDYPQEESN